MSVEECHKYAVHISDDVLESSGKSYHPLIVPACFNPICRFNDLQYLDRDNSTQMAGQTNERKRT